MAQIVIGPNCHNLVAVQCGLVEMNAGVYTKQTVESLPLGGLSVSITGSNHWNVADRAQRLADAISLLVEDASIRASIPACALLRLVVVTCDIKGELARWQRQLERPVSITANAEGVTAGKCLLWGSGDPESTYAIVIFSEKVGVALINGEDSSGSRTRALLVHELAHIQDDYNHLKFFGRTEPPMNDDWDGIRHAIAIAAWGEYFAESIAAPYFNDDSSELRVTFVVELVRGCLHRTRQAISEYRSHGDIGVLWQVACDEISNIFCHFGRVIGFMREMYPDDNAVSEQIFDAIYGLSRSWGQVTRQLDLDLNAIAGQHEWDSQTFLSLEDVVAGGFNASGFYPKIDGRGLRVDVVPPRDN